MDRSIRKLGRMDFFRSYPEEAKLIVEKLSLRDTVVFQMCSKECHELITYRSFKGEPFFLHCSPSDSNPSYYGFSLNRWIELLLPTGLPVSFRHLRPLSSSGGLLLFSGVPGNCTIELRRPQWWPLVVVNPLTRESRLLLPLLEVPPHFPYNIYPETYSDILMGLKVNQDSKTYKVVVHWKSNQVVQIYDSGSSQWSFASIPRKLEAYADSSEEIVVCSNYGGMYDDLQWTIFDIGHGRLIDHHFYEDAFSEHVMTGWAANVNLILARESTIAGESCLYALSYNVCPTSYLRIHRKDRSSDWQLLTEAPWRDLFNRTEIINSVGSQRLPKFHIYECGKHLLFAVSLGGTWGGAVYDLDTQVWNPDFVVKRNPGSRELHDGLFFQPQLNGPRP